jgi:hypothetical protein
MTNKFLNLLNRGDWERIERRRMKKRRKRIYLFLTYISSLRRREKSIIFLNLDFLFVIFVIKDFFYIIHILTFVKHFHLYSFCLIHPF